MNLDDLMAEGELALSVDGDDGVIRLKARATFDEPVELSADAARELAQRLIELADEIG
ncbi:hypothetical protein [Opitutus terrae]|uniref:Uncharacterized protein n=1 Tax=Opitutus terrae (strain DSM 11246 / JCM 15787 / PB90-1) TaxID=452637 RepID=B1ZSW6_OPITP|nr:hypothetical protein [Opitutus terrae]ACB75755.1 hypothetical protein Oter_2473 [Opitutus terrae PB90-1]